MTSLYLQVTDDKILLKRVNTSYCKQPIVITG